MAWGIYLLYSLANETRDDRIPVLLLPENCSEVLYISDLSRFFQTSSDSSTSAILPQNSLFSLAIQLSPIAEEDQEIVEIALGFHPNGHYIVVRQTPSDLSFRLMAALESGNWISEKTNFWHSPSGLYTCNPGSNYILIYADQSESDQNNLSSVPEFMRCLDRSGLSSDAVYFEKKENNRWSSIDLELQGNLLLLNGFLPNLDPSYLPTHDDPGLPVCSGADSIEAWYYSDFSQSRSAALHLWQTANREEEYNRLISDLEISCACNFAELFEDWCSGPVVTFTSQSERAIVLRSYDRQSALRKFSAFADSSAYPGAWGSIILPLESLWPSSLILGYGYTDSLRYLMVSDDIIAFGENNNVLKRLAREIDSGDILPPPPGTLNPREYLHTGATAIKEGMALFGASLGGTVDLPFEWNNTTGFVSSGGSHRVTDSLIFYNAVISLHGSGSPGNTRGELWGTKLENKASGQIHLVLNHYTNAYEALVQDERNQLYLISGEGAILWKAEVDGPVISQVQQIDAFRNGKLQMAFNTRSSVYLIDRNGKSLEGFPVRLKSPASGSLAVFDYDRDGSYRFIQTLEDGGVANLNVQGQAVKGWKINKLPVPALSAEHLRFGKKDYLLFALRNGEIHVRQRDGSEVDFAPIPLQALSHSSLSLQKSTDILSSGYIYADTSGLLHAVMLDGKSTSLFRAKGRVSWLSSPDMNNDGDPEILTMSEGEVCMHTIDSALVWCNPCDIAPIIMPSPDGEGMLLGCTFRGESYLLNPEGKAVYGSPFEGVSNPVMNRPGSGRQTLIFYLSDPFTVSARPVE